MDAENEAKIISKRIKMLRRDTHMSQQDLAKKLTDVRGCEVGQSLVSKWESGMHTPERMNLLALAKIYNVSTDFLNGLSDDPGEFVEVEDEDGFTRRKLRDDEKVLLDSYRKLSAKDKEFIARAIELIKRDNP